MNCLRDALLKAGARLIEKPPDHIKAKPELDAKANHLTGGDLTRSNMGLFEMHICPCLCTLLYFDPRRIRGICKYQDPAVVLPNRLEVLGCSVDVEIGVLSFGRSRARASPVLYVHDPNSLNNRLSLIPGGGGSQLRGS